MKIKRLLAVLISTALVVSMIPSFVFADEAEGETEETKVTETTVEETKPTEKETEPSEPERKEETEPSEKEPAETEASEPAAPAETDETKEAEPSEPAESEPSEAEGEEKTDPETDSQEAMDKIVKSGDCGTTAKWSLDDKGKMTISGTGYFEYTNDWSSINLKVKSVVIKDGITTIGNCAFFGFKNLTSVSVPESVTEIDDLAFCNCYALKTINMPKNLTKIGTTAFNSCTSLQSITIPGGVKTVGSAAFDNCKALTKVVIEDGVKNIDRVFGGCINLTSISIPESVTSMNAAFVNCTSLKSVNIPSSITSIGNDTFKGCTSLASIKLHNGITEIGAYAFQQSGLESITIPRYVESIGYRAFWHCERLKIVYIDDTVYPLVTGMQLFDGCKSLTTVRLPYNIENLPSYFFRGCTSLKEITIPTSVKSIEEGVFYNCSALTDVYYNQTVSKWNSITIGENNTELTNASKHFNGTFHTISVRTANGGSISLSKYSAVAGETITVTVRPDPGYYFAHYDYDNTRTTKLQFIMPDKNITIEPEFNKIVQANIGDIFLDDVLIYAVTNNAMNGTGTVICRGFVGIAFDPLNPPPFDQIYASAEIPAVLERCGITYKVTAIANNAFKDDKYLKKVIIGSNVTVIGSNAFYGCKNLTSVSGGARVKTIGANAFAKCPKLSSFTITSKVLAKIGATCFTGDTKLKTLNFKYTTKLSKKGVKKSLKGSSVKTVKVKKSKVKKYKKFFTKKNCGKKVKVKK